MQKEQFIEAITREQEALRRFLLVKCHGDAFMADDIAQEALLKAYMSFEHYEGRAKFSTWLFRIAYNCLYDHTTKRPSVETEVLECISDTEIDEDLEADRNFKNQQLHLAIKNLSPPEQTVTLLFYMEEKNIREIEEITSMPSGTIRSHLSRARQHLKEFLENKLI